MPRKKKEVKEEVVQEEKILDNGLIRVKAVISFNDLEYAGKRKLGEEWEVTPERFDVLNGNNKFKMVFVKRV